MGRGVGFLADAELALRMNAFTFFIEDDRYTVPNLEFVLAADTKKARQLATERLLASRHHLSISVHEQGREVVRVARPGRGDDDGPRSRSWRDPGA